MHSPAFSTELYRDVVGVAAQAPAAVQEFMRHFTELSIIALLALVAVVWWRARRSGAATMAVTMLGPAAGVGAYLISEFSKVLLAEDRPCRAVGLPILAAGCPPVGDWSFPSNHSTIAGALFIAVFMGAWRWGLVALPIAVLAAFSRVFVGVHYPHDVLAGFLLGATMTVLLTRLLLRPATRFVELMRARALLGRILAAPTVEAPARSAIEARSAAEPRSAVAARSAIEAPPAAQARSAVEVRSAAEVRSAVEAPPAAQARPASAAQVAGVAKVATPAAAAAPVEVPEPQPAGAGVYRAGSHAR